MNFVPKNKFSKNSFTIVELVIAMGIFMFLMIATFGIYTVAIQRHYDAQKNQAVSQELRYAMEVMSRDIRDSLLKHGESTVVNLASKKLPGYPLSSDYLNCINNNLNYCLNYYINISSNLEENGIWAKQGSDDSSSVRLTSQDIEILPASKFYVDASSAASDNPKVTIFIEARKRNDQKDISRIYLQTTITQKDIESPNIYQ